MSNTPGLKPPLNPATPSPYVRLRIDLESMRHSVVHALVDHQGEVESAVQATLDGLLSSGHLEQQIQLAVQRHLDAVINEAVKGAMSSWTRDSPTVKQAIQSAVASALWQAER